MGARLKDHLEAAGKPVNKNLSTIPEKNDTPSRRSKRLSVSESANKDSAPATPVKRSKNVDKLSVTENQMPVTPIRRSRRLSGASLTVPELSNLSSKVNTITEEVEEDQIEIEKEPSESIEAAVNSVKDEKLEETGNSVLPENVVDKMIETSNSKIIDTAIDDVSEKTTDTDVNEEVGCAKDIDSKEVIDETKLKGVIEEPKTIEAKDMELNNAATATAEKENVPIEQVLKKMFNSKPLAKQKPKSGRFWKGERGQFRQIKRDRGQRHTFEARLKMKEEKLRNREIAATLMQRKNQAKEELRLKIEENKARKLENDKKTEQYQVIKNPAKLKRMKKKQLRMLEKRDILA